MKTAPLPASFAHSCSRIPGTVLLKTCSGAHGAVSVSRSGGVLPSLTCPLTSRAWDCRCLGAPPPRPALRCSLRAVRSIVCAFLWFRVFCVRV